MNALIVRDGSPCCLLCPRTGDLTIDHLDSNPKNNHLSNLHILCRGCNTSERNRRKAGERRLTAETAPKYRALLKERLAKAPQVTPVCVGENDTTSPPPRPSPRNAWAFGTSEEANRVMEPMYRLWVFETVTRQGSINKGDALHAGAEYLQKQVGRGSPASTERYFLKMASATGCLEQVRGPHGGLEWVFRSGADLHQLGKQFRAEAGV
jgi:hypothetical protein